MARNDSLKNKLSRLEEIRSKPQSAETVEALQEALRSKSNHLAARAAEITSELGFSELEDDLVAAFERFLEDPVKADPGCSAKTSIGECLYWLGSQREDVFLLAIQHVQLEPTYGGKQDTAAKLRAFGALGLVRSLYPGVMVHLADLLADPELDARIGAVRAIVSAGREASVPLLRFKALSGDEDPRLLQACFRGLLQLDPDSSLSFVSKFLEHDNEVVNETAALALGESHAEGAFEILRSWCEKVIHSPQAYIGLTAIALLQSDQGIDYLLSVVAGERTALAREAVAVLKIYQDDARIWGKVKKAASRRSDPIII